MPDLNGKTILVTGSAGFIGFHVAQKLLEEGVFVVGLDNFNPYYDKKLKEDRNKILESYDNFKLYRVDLTDVEAIKRVLSENPVDKVCHLAAQAGVRYSISNPGSYIQSNIVGFANLIEEVRKFSINDFIYISSSSVYGKNTKLPFSEDDGTDKQISLYAVTKKTNELIAHNYHHLFGMNCTGLRLFTVYGPYCRPDMALPDFTKKICNGDPVVIYNKGNVKRDFTHVNDAVTGIINSLKYFHPWEIINIGSGKTISVDEVITLLEKNIGKKANRKYEGSQPGDMVETRADISRAKNKLQYKPSVDMEEGVKDFVDWYKNYYKILD